MSTMIVDSDGARLIPVPGLVELFQMKLVWLKRGAHLSRKASANSAHAAKASGAAICHFFSFVAFEWYALPRITAAAMPKGMAVRRATIALFVAPPA